MTAELSEEEFDRWLKPVEVLERLPGLAGPDTHRHAIAKRMLDGLIRVCAGTVAVGDARPVERFELDKRFWKGWAFLAQTRENVAFWTLGEFERMDSDSTGYSRHITARLYDIRFNPDDVAKMVRDVTPRPSAKMLARVIRDMPALPAPTPTAAPANHKRRGPKPKAFWGDAMAAAEASISGNPMPDLTLADVERVMAQWIDDQGYDAGESTIRNYAKPVWERLANRGQ